MLVHRLVSSRSRGGNSLIRQWLKQRTQASQYTKANCSCTRYFFHKLSILTQSPAKLKQNSYSELNCSAALLMRSTNWDLSHTVQNVDREDLKHNSLMKQTQAPTRRNMASGISPPFTTAFHYKCSPVLKRPYCSSELHGCESKRKHNIYDELVINCPPFLYSVCGPCSPSTDCFINKTNPFSWMNEVNFSTRG